MLDCVYLLCSEFKKIRTNAKSFDVYTHNRYSMNLKRDLQPKETHAVTKVTNSFLSNYYILNNTNVNSALYTSVTVIYPRCFHINYIHVTCPFFILMDQFNYHTSITLYSIAPKNFQRHDYIFCNCL